MADLVFDIKSTRVYFRVRPQGMNDGQDDEGEVTVAIIGSKDESSRVESEWRLSTDPDFMQRYKCLASHQIFVKGSQIQQLRKGPKNAAGDAQICFLEDSLGIVMSYEFAGINGSFGMISTKFLLSALQADAPIIRVVSRAAGSRFTASDSRRRFRSDSSD